MLLTVGAVLFLLVAVKHGSASRGALVTISFNTNGMPTILGISLGTGAVRQITFRTLKWAHLPVRIIVPSPSTRPGYQPNPPMNDANFARSMNAILKSGLVSTNKPTGPSPYE